ncbi:MAG TPA: metal/formaldehyde-sensitive transcriptional repressor, partial [Vicinamibacterales bacterium]|nr:metal/formaldehyde-sensitive transcriptional repressor [Vicinamibacterales bacterium]
GAERRFAAAPTTISCVVTIPRGVYGSDMPHRAKNKDKLMNRVRRIRGQLDAVAAGIESEAECAKVLQTLVACRGALNSLVIEFFDDHVRYHIADPKQRPTAAQTEATQEVIDLLRACL